MWLNHASIWSGLWTEPVISTVQLVQRWLVWASLDANCVLEVVLRFRLVSSVFMSKTISLPLAFSTFCRQGHPDNRESHTAVCRKRTSLLICGKTGNRIEACVVLSGCQSGAYAGDGRVSLRKSEQRMLSAAVNCVRWR